MAKGSLDNAQRCVARDMFADGHAKGPIDRHLVLDVMAGHRARDVKVFAPYRSCQLPTFEDVAALERMPPTSAAHLLVFALGHRQERSCLRRRRRQASPLLLSDEPVHWSAPPVPGGRLLPLDYKGAL